MAKFLNNTVHALQVAVNGVLRIVQPTADGAEPDVLEVPDDLVLDEGHDCSAKDHLEHHPAAVIFAPSQWKPADDATKQLAARKPPPDAEADTEATPPNPPVTPPSASSSTDTTPAGDAVDPAAQ